MPKATLTFNLPEEQREHELAVNAAAWKDVVYELSVLLRNKLKYGHEYKTADDALEDIRKELWEYCNDNKLDPWGD